MSLSILEKSELKLRAFMLNLRIAMNRTRCRAERAKTKDEIINDSRILSNDYVDDRLIRSGLNFKQRKISQAASKMGNSKDEPTVVSGHLNIAVKPENIASMEAIQIMTEKRHSPEGCLLTIDDLSKVLMYVGEALEVRHPTVYTDILQQLNIRSLGEVNMRRIFMSVAKDLFAEGINWPKIVSFFAFAGGLAVDCVLNGSSVYVTRIKNWIVEFIETDLAEWIIAQGSWVSKKLEF